MDTARRLRRGWAAGGVCHRRTARQHGPRLCCRACFRQFARCARAKRQAEAMGGPCEGGTSGAAHLCVGWGTRTQNNPMVRGWRAREQRPAAPMREGAAGDERKGRTARAQLASASTDGLKLGRRDPDETENETVRFKLKKFPSTSRANPQPADFDRRAGRFWSGGELQKPRGTRESKLKPTV